MCKKLVIIPTYNEIENIKNMLESVLALPQLFDILIIDDGSPDGTAAVVKKAMEKEPKRIHLIEREGKQGLGTAYITGFMWAINHLYDFIFEMDADFSHNPNDLPKLYQACVAGASMSIGSRYCRGISVVNWPLSRVLISYFATKYVRMVLRMPLFDTTAGFVCYKREVLQKIDFDRIKMKGYGFQIEMKYNTHKLGFKITEVPIIFIDRTLGSSKMSSSIFGEAFWGVLKLRCRKIKPAQ
jgi:dolichol-phosphate mannosyltransferase